jgi:hypothetical protein
VPTDDLDAIAKEFPAMHVELEVDKSESARGHDYQILITGSPFPK